jgi:quercetin dioxygenase-like cupin family protein
MRSNLESKTMNKVSLDAIARERLEDAHRSPAGRASETVFGGHEKVLRQTVIALVAGQALDEHENPGEATLQVLRGRVTLIAGENRWDGRGGDFLIVPESRHSLEAHEDSVILLTVAKR